MYCVEVAAELLADVEEQTVRSVHQAQWPGRESPSISAWFKNGRFRVALGISARTLIGPARWSGFT